MSNLTRSMIYDWLAFVRNYRDIMQPNHASQDVILWSYDHGLSHSEGQTYLDIARNVYLRSIKEQPPLTHNEELITQLRQQKEN